MYFDGIDDYVRTQGNINLTPPFTVEVWTYSLGLVPNQWWPVVIANGYLGGLSQGFKIIYYANGRLFVEWGTGTSGQNLSPVSAPLYIWHHVALVFEGIGKNVRLYLDNQLVRSATLSVDPSRNARIYLAGAYEYQNSSRYRGYINEVHIYNRALSDSEISWNYRRFGYPVKDGLVLWLVAHPDNVKDIDGDGILEWVDLSGNNNHGKIYGATLVSTCLTPYRTLTPIRLLEPAQ
jgi:hypothetical protein